jgi:triacylglycerol lipase
VIKGSCRRLAPALVCLTLVIGCGDSTGPVERTARQPIVFVHGFGGSASDWTPVLARFRMDGYTDRELDAASYSSFVSNTSVAAHIRDRVDAVLRATGWDSVDIIAFSMGSLSSRYYLKFLDGTARVDAWVSVAGPNHGTETALQCDLTPCQEMVPGSAFLTQLNSGDETPGNVRYATWWSPCDGTIVPPESSILEGAANTQTDCLPHTGLFTETIYQQVRSFLGP